MKRKGFVHIVEIILIVIVVFTFLYQFASLKTKPQEWDKIKASLLVGDIINSLRILNTNWFNEEEVRARCDAVFPKTMVYGLSLYGIVKPKINILCYGEKCNDVANALESFTINNVTISFTIHTVDSLSELFSLYYDVAIIARDVLPDSFYNEENKYALKQFLTNDKGIIEMVNLVSDDLTDSKKKDIQNGIFSLEKTTSNGNSIVFKKNISVKTKDDFLLINYLYHTPIFHDDFNDKNKWTTSAGWQGNDKFELEPGFLGTSLYLNSTCEGERYIYTPAFNEFENMTLVLFFNFTPNSRFDVMFKGVNDFYVVSVDQWGIVKLYYLSNGHLNIIKKGDYGSIFPYEWHKLVIDSGNGKLEVFIDSKPALFAEGVWIGKRSLALEACGNGVNIDNLRVYFNEDYVFENSLAGQGVRSSEKRNIILEERGGGAAAMVINDNAVGGKGRAIWLSPTIAKGESGKAIIRFAVITAAGYYYDVIGSDVEEVESARLHALKSIDMFQPFIVELKSGYTYAG
ncbi:MAG: hypothetical protein DRP03_00925 [Candidatus Aenigmatarchaeota archaeon]|nr:MAG: hypothetical protein DRP03_00925 [Candidatus Aenigmarchaeota archaeon]